MNRILLGAFLALAVSGARAGTPVTFVTDWKAQAEHGGFYEALAEGFYAKRGLDVTIRAGGPQVNVPQLLAGGVPGAVLGAYLAGRVPSKPMRMGLSGAMALLGASLFYKGFF